MAQRVNNYDFIRLIASCLVIVGHAYVLLSVPGLPVVFQVSVSTFAVQVFFALSGYLVVTSWLNDPNAIRFLIRRGLRILPGLVAVVVASALVLGPIVTELSYADYFSNELFYLYFWNSVFYIVDVLPGVFVDNIYPNAVNGSLWSLPVEVGMYGFVLLAGLIARSHFRAAWLLLTCVWLYVNYVVFVLQSPIIDSLIVYGTGIKSVIHVAPYFMVGGCLRLFPRWVPFRPIITLAVLIAAYLLTKTGWAFSGVLLIVAITYLVVSFGSYSTPVLCRFGRYGDMSYGVYLYGFPVAQCFSMVFGNTLSVESHIVLTIAVTLVLAQCSWHFIEAPALRFKPKRSSSPFWALGRRVVSSVPSAPPAASDAARPSPASAHVAVLMCTFNGERFLADQIESILQQDHRNYRIWVSDDGSSDRTLSILDEYRARLGEDKFRIVSGPRRGFASNFLSLLHRPEIEADYFAFADQDDIWERNKLSCALAAIGREVPGVPVVYCSRSRLVDSENIEIGLSPNFRRPPSFRNAIIQSIGGGNTMVIDRSTRELACKADASTVVSHDWWLYLLVTGAGGEMIFDSAPTVRYRQHQSNLVGMNVGLKMKWQRLRMLVRGQFRQWNDINLLLLNKNRHLLTPEHRQVLDEFSAARNLQLFPRLRGIWRSGAYRQTVIDELIVFLAIIARRV